MADGGKKTAKPHTRSQPSAIEKTRDHSSILKQVFIGQFTESAVVTIPKEEQTQKSREGGGKRRETNKKRNFYTFYKVSMLISPSSSSKTNVRTTSGLGPMQNLPKVPGGEGVCEEGDDITRLCVTLDEGNS